MAIFFENSLKDWADLYDWKNYLLALEEIQNLAERNPDNPIFSYLHAVTLLKIGRYQEAKEKLSALISILNDINARKDIKDKTTLLKIIQVSKELIAKIDKKDYSFPNKNPIEWIQSGLKDSLESISEQCKNPLDWKSDKSISSNFLQKTAFEDKFKIPKFPEPPKKEPAALSQSSMPEPSKIPPPITPIFTKKEKEDKKSEIKFSSPKPLFNDVSDIKETTGKPFEPFKSFEKKTSSEKTDINQFQTDTARMVASMQSSKDEDINVDEPISYQNKRGEDKFDHFETFSSPDSKKDINNVLKSFYPQEIIAFILVLIAAVFRSKFFAVVGVIFAVKGMNLAKKERKAGNKDKKAVLGFICLIIGIIVFISK